MRKRTIIVALIAGACAVAATVAAAPDEHSRTDSSRSDSDNDSSEAIPAGRGRLGFGALEISPDLRRYFGAPADRGVLVNQLRADSPAARAGLRVGDVVVDVDGRKVDSVAGIVDAIANQKKGETVALDVERDRSRMTLRATLDTNPGPRVEAFGRSNGGQWQRIEPNGNVPNGNFPNGFDPQMFFGNPQLQHELDATRQRLDQLEQRLDKLEHR